MGVAAQGQGVSHGVFTVWVCGAERSKPPEICSCRGDKPASPVRVVLGMAPSFEWKHIVTSWVTRKRCIWIGPEGSNIPSYGMEAVMRRTR